jgi:hypothetical protein
MTRRQLFKLCGALATAVVLGPGCDSVSSWIHPDRCALCHRRVHAGMAVRVAVAGHAPETACCLRCAISYAEQTDKAVRVLSVTDYLSHTPISAASAVYVVDSAVEPCSGPPLEVPANRHGAPVLNWDRCLPSVIAFAARADAEEFQTQNGGRIESFHDLVQGTPVFAAPRRPGFLSQPRQKAGRREHA